MIAASRLMCEPFSHSDIWRAIRSLINANHLYSNELIRVSLEGIKMLTLLIISFLATMPVISSRPQTPLSLFPISKEVKPDANPTDAESVEYWDKKGWISNLQNIFRPPLDWTKNPTSTTTSTTTAKTSSIEPDITTSDATVNESSEAPTNAVPEKSEDKLSSETSEVPTESTQQPEQPDVLIARPQDDDKGDDKRKRMPWLAQTVVKHPIHPGVVGSNKPPVWSGPQEVNKPPEQGPPEKKPGQYLPPDGSQPVISIQQWMNENRPTHPIAIESNSRPLRDPMEGKPSKGIDNVKEETVRPSPIKPNYDPAPWEKPVQNNRPFPNRPPPNVPNQDYEPDFDAPQYPEKRPQLKPPPNVRPTLPDLIPDQKPNKVGRPEEQKGWGKPPSWNDKPYPEPVGDTNGLGGNIFGDGTGNGIGGMGNVNGIGGGIIGSGSGNGEGGFGNQNGIGGNVIEDNAANGVGGSGDENGLGGFVVGNNSGNGKGGVGNNNGIGGNRGGKHSANGTGGVGNHNGKGGIIIGTNSGNGNGGIGEGYGQRPRP